MNISDEAVEAAFLSMWGPNPSNPSDSGDAHLLKELRKALESAAPYMLAGAWEDAYSLGFTDAKVGAAPNRTNPYRSQA